MTYRFILCFAGWKVTWSTRREICGKILIYLKLIFYYHKYHSHILIVSKNTYFCIYFPASFSKRVFLITCIFQNYEFTYVYSLLIIYFSVNPKEKKNIFFLSCEIPFLKSLTGDASPMIHTYPIQCFKNWSLTLSQLRCSKMHTWDRWLRWLDHPLEFLLI